MHPFLHSMNDPQIVANFQKTFGLEWEFDDKLTEKNYSKVDINNNQNAQKLINTDKSSIKDRELAKNAQNSKNYSNGHLNNGYSSSTITETTTLTTSNHKINDTTSKTKDKEYTVTNTDHTHIVSRTKINNRLWYYFFHIGAAMGNEIFYSIFFPCWFWNVDGAIARKICMLWGIFMFVGQATKDLFCMPRPASPPVVKLEQRYVLEYGFPSTHAMVACGLPLSLVSLCSERYAINLPVSLFMASLFCLWVCCSRLYLGMHSLLDVTAGVLYALFCLIFVIPVLEPTDKFIMTYDYAPWILFPLGFLICYSYPKVKRWSTTRGDTAIVVGTVIGFSIGSSLNMYLNILHKPEKPPLYDIRYPDALGYVTVVIRTIFGMAMLLLSRQVAKAFWKRFLCVIFSMDSQNVNHMRKKRIEIPLNYLTYMILGFNVTFFSPYVFRLLNIERDYSYTEL